MSSDCGQLGRAMDEAVDLFPYPDQLTAYHFSMSKVFTAKERSSSGLQVEFQLISPVEFRVQTSHVDRTFIDLVLKSHRNLKYERDTKFPNVYYLSLKNYIYVLSKVKYLQGDCYMTINHNHFDTDFIKILMKNLTQNDNILSFIQNRKRRKDIIQSLDCDPKFGKHMKLLTERNVFNEDFNEHQLIAFYMAVVRNGRAILADRADKSLTALTIMTYFRDDWPLVIVCERKRRKYWSNDVFERFKCTDLFRISAVDSVDDIYVYPKPFHDIMIMDYDLYYEIKDTVSFRALNIKAFIFEDQTRGNPQNLHKQWKGLSSCVDDLQRANRIIFICCQPFESDKFKRWFPLLQILDMNSFSDYGKFEQRYCNTEETTDLIRDQMIKEFQLLLRLTFLICDKPFD